jgi:hypothetical protein
MMNNYIICSKHAEDNFQVRHPSCVVQNYKYNQYTVKHNSINDFIKVYFLYCFVQRHVSTLVMGHLQAHYFS